MAENPSDRDEINRLHHRVDELHNALEREVTRRRSAEARVRQLESFLLTLPTKLPDPLSLNK